MRKSIKTTDAIFPMPVLMIATYNDDGTVNVMNAAWGAMADRDIITLFLDENRKTVKNIKKRRAFTVSIADANHVAEADYFGIASGHKVPDKLAAAGLTATRSELVDAPIINEFPVCMECRYIEYPVGEYGPTVVGKIVNASADEKVIANGKVDVSRLSAIAYDSFTHGYYKVNERVGEAFSDGESILKGNK